MTRRQLESRHKQLVQANSTLNCLFCHCHSIQSLPVLKHNLLQEIQELVAAKNVIVSSHGYDELAADNIFVQDMLDSVHAAFVVEEYPDFYKGPCLLVLQKDSENKPVHVVWGIAKGKTAPAVLITAYRPDPDRWEGEFKRRKP